MSLPRLRFHPGCACAAATLAVTIAFGPAGACAARDLYVDYSEKPDPDHLLAYDVCILSPHSKADLKPGQKLGNRYLAYLSLVEVSSDAAYREELVASGIPFLAENTDWGSNLVDVADSRWQEFVTEKLAGPAAGKGFDGFFLDTVDSMATLTAKDPKRAGDFRKGLVGIIRALRKKFPEKQIVINRGFDLLQDLKTTLNGVLVESVFRSFDPKTRDYVAVAPETTAELKTQIARAQEFGLDVYVLDYAAPDDAEAVRLAEKESRALGCIPFVGTRDLQGKIAGARGMAPRRILVLFGLDPEEAETHRIWPTDTTSFAILQMPLEWMGYELDYHDVTQGAPKDLDRSRYAGVILDEELEIPYRIEREFADWLLTMIEEKKKILFLGSYGFNDPIEESRIFSALGIRGTENPPIPAQPPVIAHLDEEIMNFEIDAKPNRRDFMAIQAPERARKLLSLTAAVTSEPDSGVLHFDPVYLADWGGALLSPYIGFAASEETILQYADPFAFLGRIWPAGAFPAPDPTTRDGLRIFYTHVDGDGFSSISYLEEDVTCAEILYNEFLKDLPWPITISIVESEIRGHMLQQKPDESKQLIELARKIYALPHVEPASHSYSHPYLWIDDDTQFVDLYDGRNLELKLTARYPKIDVRREIEGSLSFIDGQLTPKDKPARLMLWSGDCRPSPEALAITEELGVENMNGGNTILCSRYPGLAAVAPRVVSWDGHLQIHAANQNEFMYTDGWEGPFFGGFAQVIETFEATETPRRLKPVNVYYHFYSVERADSLRALRKIYDWCRSQPLHPVTANEFATLTRDAHETRVVRTGERTWVALSRGHCRTFRIPSDLGTPDIGASSGVAGFREHGEWTYIHTTGAPRTVITLADEPERHAFLETADSRVTVGRLSRDSIRLHVGSREARLAFAGFEPGGSLSITVNERATPATADNTGRLTVKAPADSTLTVQHTP